MPYPASVGWGRVNLICCLTIPPRTLVQAWTSNSRWQAQESKLPPTKSGWVLKHLGHSPPNISKTACREWSLLVQKSHDVSPLYCPKTQSQDHSAPRTAHCSSPGDPPTIQNRESHSSTMLQRCSIHKTTLLTLSLPLIVQVTCTLPTGGALDAQKMLVQSTSYSQSE